MYCMYKLFDFFSKDTYVREKSFVTSLDIVCIHMLLKDLFWSYLHLFFASFNGVTAGNLAKGSHKEGDNKKQDELQGKQ